jgi:hypothetical protein
MDSLYLIGLWSFFLVFEVALNCFGCHVRLMGKIAAGAILLIAWQARAFALAPLHDPVALNIGINCQWQRSCQRRQQTAMVEARQYVVTVRPPLWRIHMCNRNARRGTASLDWIGFDNCVRNAQLPQPRHRAR